MKAAHAALARNDRGGLKVRHFDSAEDAARASAERELPSPDAAPPVGVFAALPDILETLRVLNARKLRLTPSSAGGFEVEVVETNRLYVSRRELAEMLPLFTPATKREDYVDKLVELGIPHVNATGSRLYNVPKVHAWLELHFGCGGKMPTKVG
jgi:hypothetical protein